MSLFPKILKGNAGVVTDQIQAGVIYKYWSKGRAKWGEDVVLGALVSGWEDGTSVKLIVYEADGGENDDFVEELEASIDKGLAHATYTIDFEDPDQDEGGEYEFYFLVEIDGETQSTREQCPLLYVDLGLPPFSE